MPASRRVRKNSRAWPARAVNARPVATVPADFSVTRTSSGRPGTSGMSAVRRASSIIQRSWWTVEPSAVTAPVSSGRSIPPSRTPSTGVDSCLSSASRWALGSAPGLAWTRPMTRWPRTALASRSRACTRRERSSSEPTTMTTGARLSCSILAPMPPKAAPISTGNNGPSRNSKKALLITVAVKSRRAMTKAEPMIRFSFMPLRPPARCRPFPGPPPRRRWRRRRRADRAARCSRSRCRRRRRSAP